MSATTAKVCVPSDVCTVAPTGTKGAEADAVKRE